MDDIPALIPVTVVEDKVLNKGNRLKILVLEDVDDTAVEDKVRNMYYVRPEVVKEDIYLKGLAKKEIDAILDLVCTGNTVQVAEDSILPSWPQSGTWPRIETLRINHEQQPVE